MKKLHELYHALLSHDGFGELRMDIRILKRGQKEVIIYCGKQYRFVVDVPDTSGEKNRGKRNEQKIQRQPGKEVRQNGIN
jgi:hypothetical protein